MVLLLACIDGSEPSPDSAPDVPFRQALAPGGREPPQEP